MGVLECGSVVGVWECGGSVGVWECGGGHHFLLKIICPKVYVASAVNSGEDFFSQNFRFFEKKL